MAKIVLNGTSGLTAYKSDNSTVEIAYTPTQLVGLAPEVFKSASPFIISKRSIIDSSVTPAVIKHPDMNDDVLLQALDVSYVTRSSETMSGNDRTHTMPSGIQANDLLIMAQYVNTRSTDGYGPNTNGAGDGFTSCGSSSTSAQIGSMWYYRPGGQYDIGACSLSYKIAAGNESSTNIGNFQTQAQAAVTAYGVRTLYVFRATYSYSGVTFTKVNNTIGSSGATSISSHTLSTSASGSSTAATVGIVQYASSASGQTPSGVTGSVTSFDAAVSQTQSGGGGFMLRTAYTAAFGSQAPTGTVTATGVSNTTNGDALFMTLFTLTPS